MVRHFYFIYILCTSKYFVMYLSHPHNKSLFLACHIFVPASLTQIHKTLAPSRPKSILEAVPTESVQHWKLCLPKAQLCQAYRKLSLFVPNESTGNYLPVS